MGKNSYVEQPLNYWERDSYFQIILSDYDNSLLDGIVDRLSKIDGLIINKIRGFSKKNPPRIKFTYEGENYEIGYYPSEFSFLEMYARGPYYVSDEELNKIRKAKCALNLFMAFNRKNAKKSYHVQLKVALAIASDALGIIDESAEKLLPIKWVKMAAHSKAGISANDLYTIQAILDNGEVWLHTHGLNRCGISELEVLQSNRNSYNSHYNLISTYASYLLENPSNKPTHIGYFSNRQPIVATYMSWVKALNEYDELDVGNASDRKEGHNTKTSVIFLCENNEIFKVWKYDELLSDNPLFFISKEETKVITNLARERFEYVKRLSKDKDNEIFMKIALPIVDQQEHEHIYFKFISFEDDNKFKAVLLQKPYANVGISRGDERIFTVDDVSDWYVNTASGTITPSKVYTLDDE